MKHREVPVETLREALSYDPESGVLTWLWRASRRGCQNAKYAGKAAGYLNKNGYVSIRVDGVLLLAHRAIWAHVHGKWPEDEIDHRNGVKSDNRISNLRSASRSDQLANAKRRCDSKSGIRGVCWDAREGRWLATINKNKRQIRLGLFDKIQDAKAAYTKAAEEIFGEFVRRENGNPNHA